MQIWNLIRLGCALLRFVIVQNALLPFLTLCSIRRTLRISRISSAICSTSFGSPSSSIHLALPLATTFAQVRRWWNANLTVSSPDSTLNSKIVILTSHPTFRRPRGRAT